MRSGIATSNAVPRYVRPLTGRSIEPGRGRLDVVGGRGEAICRGYSREGRLAAPTPGGDAPVPDSSTILLVDDEDSIQKVLSYPLERDGFRVLAARDGEEALAKFASEPVDLVVLDLMLPKIDGLEVCKRLRAQSTVPIIMLTARDDELDKVLGLELGADDYITKPFSIREFRSRVRALLRRASLPAQQDQRRTETIETDGLRIDPTRRSVEVHGRPIQLTYVEFELLRTLAANPGQVFSRRRLLESLWGDSAYREPRTIDVHVRHLREKLERDPSDPEYILTVRGAGYRFRDT
jgi:DNA-binding response OmpR family regulator